MISASPFCVVRLAAGFILMAGIVARGQTPTVVMKSHVLIDKGMNNMNSHTILAPADWKVEGGGWWPSPPSPPPLPCWP